MRTVQAADAEVVTADIKRINKRFIGYRKNGSLFFYFCKTWEQVQNRKIRLLRRKVDVMITEKKEKRILMMSFISGLAFAVIEFIFSIYSHSQSALTDAVYDASELVFIALLLFLTPLFHKPVSEKHPYGYFQIESIFVIIKGVMMLSVTMGVSAEIIESALAGGNAVNNAQIFCFSIIFWG